MEQVVSEANKEVHGGRFLTFELNKEEYGLEILKVREIIGFMQITTVPQTINYLKGVVNLRGKVIPVIDLRLKFGMAELEYGDRTCIIVINVNSTLVGIIVDTVSEVVDIATEAIEPTPSLGHGINTELISGMGKVKGGVMILLDIEKVLNTEELVILESAIGEGESVEEESGEDESVEEESVADAN